MAGGMADEPFPPRNPSATNLGDDQARCGGKGRGLCAPYPKGRVAVAPGWTYVSPQVRSRRSADPVGLRRSRLHLVARDYAIWPRGSRDLLDTVNHSMIGSRA